MAKWEELAKTIVIIAVPVVGVAFLIYIVYAWLTGQQLINLWKKQYEDYIKELRQYAEQDKGNITPEHQEILRRKENMMQNTQQSLFQLVPGRSLSWYADVLFKIVVGVLTAYFGTTIAQKWISYFKGRGGTAKGQTYIARCAAIDDYFTRGETAIASALATVTINYFQTVDMPFMQSEIARYQQLAQTVTGWMYYYAIYMRQWYTIELQSIPFWFTMLPPLPP